VRICIEHTEVQLGAVGRTGNDFFCFSRLGRRFKNRAVKRAQMFRRRELRKTNSSERAAPPGKRPANASIAAHGYAQRVAGNRDARKPIIRGVAQRSIGAARKLSIARIEPAPVAVEQRKETRAVDREIERTGASGELTLGEKHSRTERNRSKPPTAGRDQLGKALRRSFKADDAGVG